jgi:hypothetical protein
LLQAHAVLKLDIIQINVAGIRPDKGYTSVAGDSLKAHNGPRRRRVLGHPGGAYARAKSPDPAVAKTADAESAAGTVRVTVLFRIMFFTPYYRPPASLSGGALFALLSADGGN